MPETKARIARHVGDQRNACALMVTAFIVLEHIGNLCIGVCGSGDLGTGFVQFLCL